MPDATHVRLALPADAAIIAEVQRAAWSADPLLAAAIAELSLADATQVWHQVIVKPPLAHFRVFVALDNNQVVGVALIGPSDDQDADATDALMHEFSISPQYRGKGHGSRLMQAGVDAMRLDGYQRATWWLNSTDDLLRTWLVSAGWETDGAHRELGTEDGSQRLKQIRLHTDISTD